MIRLGIDLGGTKIEIIALDASGCELFRQRIATPQGDYLGTVKAIERLVRGTEKVLGAQGSVGIGTPGALSTQTGLMKNSNSTCLNGQPLLQDLENALTRNIRIANDANCFALSEATDGAAAGAACVFGVIVGTGTGAGIVVNGHVLTGANAIAGEWGHNPLPWPLDHERLGPACYCGKTGCIETYLSGPGMSADHLATTGIQLSPPAILELAEAGDADCETTLRRYEDRLARSLAHIINILDPNVIVMGGGMSNMTRIYHNIPNIWGRYVFSDTVHTPLLAPVYGDSSGVRGAAWLSAMI